MASTPLRTASRVWLGLAAAAIVAGFAIAAFLRADPSGQGTHKQMGLPECAVKAVFGKPCPSCGLTTSLTHFTQGRWAESYHVQEVGPVVGLASILAVLVCGDAAIFGRWRLPTGPLLTAVLAVWMLNTLLIARWLIVVGL